MTAIDAQNAPRRAHFLESFGMPESLNDALIECVKACGGSKAAGVALWPAKGIDAAQRQLLACLNPERHEKLGPDEMLHLMRMAREVGCHVGMTYLAHELGYAEPQPVEPENERVQLQREFIESTKTLARLAQRIEQLGRPSELRAAA
jgi:hypothetical protein